MLSLIGKVVYSPCIHVLMLCGCSKKSPPASLYPSSQANPASSVSCVRSLVALCMSSWLFAIKMMLSAHMMWLHSIPCIWYPVLLLSHLVVVSLWMCSSMLLNSSGVLVPPWYPPFANGNVGVCVCVFV